MHGRIAVSQVLLVLELRLRSFSMRAVLVPYGARHTILKSPTGEAQRANAHTQPRKQVTARSLTQPRNTRGGSREPIHAHGRPHVHAHISSSRLLHAHQSRSPNQSLRDVLPRVSFSKHTQRTPHFSSRLRKAHVALEGPGHPPPTASAWRRRVATRKGGRGLAVTLR